MSGRNYQTTVPLSDSYPVVVGVDWTSGLKSGTQWTEGWFATSLGDYSVSCPSTLEGGQSEDVEPK